MVVLSILVDHDVYQTLKQYLKELVENAYTGCWAKEVAESLLKNTDG